jgi:biotin carboxylase
VEEAVLMVGAGRHQRRAIERARELGLRVVGIDRNPDAPGLAAADDGVVVDFTDVDAVIEAGRRHGVDGVLTVSADRAVPIVAAAAEALGLPGIGVATAHLMTHKVAMRRRFADRGVGGPRAACAVGIDLVEVALLQALGLDVPDELVKPRFSPAARDQVPAASPGPLPTGRVHSFGSLEKVLAFPGVVQAELYLQEGETIRPVRLDGDRRGYAIAVADTNLEALERAEAAATLVDVIVE